MTRAWNKVEKIRLAEFVNYQEAAPYLALPVNRTNLSKNRTGRKELLKSIYDSLVEKNVRYAFEKYKPDQQSQEIRSPKEILVAPREGTCLDLAILFCSLCLANELLPVIIIIEGHAFAAVSLDNGLRNWNDFSRSESGLFEEQGFTSNVAEIKELIDDGKYLAVECTGFAESEALSPESAAGNVRTNGFFTFEQAIDIGRKQLDLTEQPFEFAIDIATAQFYKGIKPVAPAGDLLESNPFKLLEPYTAADANSFFGRKIETQNIIKAVENHGFVFVTGETGCGKTSILSAGVTGELIRRDSRRKIIQTSDYSGLREHFSTTLGGAENRELIYILDQFEDILDPVVSETDRADFLKKLIESEKSSKVKFIIATGRYEEIKDYFTSVAAEKIEIGLLKQDEIANIIIYSLEQNGFTNTSREKLIKLVVPELEALNVESKEFVEDKGVYPPLLQIVCFKLAEIAQNRSDRIVGERLFDSDYKSAKHIVTGYIEEKLREEFPSEAKFEQAIEVFDAILTTNIKEWFSPADLSKKEPAKTPYFEQTLEKLYSLGLLKKRTEPGGPFYSLSAPWVYIAINLIADEKIKYEKLARIVMRSAWKAWIVQEGQLASAEQIKNLSPHVKLLQLEPVGLLFLLRSAVERKLPVKPFLDAFTETEPLREFAGQLENDPSQITGATAENVKRLLNYPEQRPISENAVSNDSPGARQTSALLLTVIGNDPLDYRVSGAFRKIDDKLSLRNINGRQRSRLLAELRGIIEEVYPDESEKINRGGLKNTIRLRIYYWLLKRRFGQNREFIFKAALFGALIGGLGLGVDWALFPAIKDVAYGIKNGTPLIVEWGNFFTIGVTQGIALGASLVFGFVSSAVFLDRSKKEPVREILKSAELNWKEWLFIMTSGAISYTAAHVLLLVSIGGDGKNLLYLTAVGLILGLTGVTGYLAAQKSGNLFGEKNWILGGYVSAILCALLQYSIIARGAAHFDINWVWDREGLKEDIHLPFEFWQSFTGSFPDWTVLFACFSAFLFGLTLFLSIYMSIRISGKNLEDKN